MRTERPEPWGFDLYDPRLTIRQLAADAQRKYEPDEREPEEPADGRRRELLPSLRTGSWSVEEHANPVKDHSWYERASWRSTSRD